MTPALRRFQVETVHPKACPRQQDPFLWSSSGATEQFSTIVPVAGPFLMTSELTVFMKSSASSCSHYFSRDEQVVPLQSEGRTVSCSESFLDFWRTRLGSKERFCGSSKWCSPCDTSAARRFVSGWLLKLLKLGSPMSASASRAPSV